MKVIHLPSMVGGNPYGISRHLSELGVTSETWILERNFFNYPSDRVLFGDQDGVVLRNIKKIAAMSYLFKCDIVFYNNGIGLYDPFWQYPKRASGLLALAYKIYAKYSSLMSHVECYLIKKLGVRVFIQYQGDDARQGSYIKRFPINIASRVGDDYYSEYTDEAKINRIKYYDAIASKIYALNPDLIHVLSSKAEFLPYSHISLMEWLPTYAGLSGGPLKIAHAPSHRGVKGTDLIINAVNQLKNEGFEFEFILIEGVGNAEAKILYQNVDVIVDQLFAGWYGGLAVEAMALGKPVIAYIREEDLKYIPLAMAEELPIVRAEPGSIYEIIKYILELSAENLNDISKKSRRYVERWHDPVNIAKRIKRDMEDALRGGG